MKTAKRILRKCKVAKQDPRLGILNYRNAPSAELDASPIQRFIDRRTRTVIPIFSNTLEPTAKNLKEEIKKLKKKQEKQTDQYNKGAKDLPRLDEGEDGNTYRRNRAHLKESTELSPFEDTARQLEEAKSDSAKTLGQETMKDKTDNVKDKMPKPQSVEADHSRTTTRSGRVIKTPSYLKDVKM
ncbi:hypothetical protein LSH36_55g09038 [Paralvinella palmiformis]|uniref:Uncharacterized protein n=1 Tax=Paralvinella palmiformis TaxID=53620 RepID=A0AAD9K553_9ANNE|nr:hypothetical protein LSH36_55g09038 [Paralvinella palmiformis]